MKCKLCSHEASLIPGKRGEASDKWIFPGGGYSFIWPINEGTLCYFHRKTELGLFDFKVNKNNRPKREAWE